MNSNLNESFFSDVHFSLTHGGHSPRIANYVAAAADDEDLRRQVCEKMGENLVQFLFIVSFFLECRNSSLDWSSKKIWLGTFLKKLVAC